MTMELLWCAFYIPLISAKAAHDLAVHQPVRRRRLWHAAVRAGLRARGHTRADEFCESRTWRLCDDGGICLRGAGQPIRLAVLRRPAAGVCRERPDRRGVRTRALPSPL